VVEDVVVMPEKVIESHCLIRCEDDVRELRYADKKCKEFMEKVIKVNLDLVKGYRSENYKEA
jgi:hypothetical protein